MRRRSATTDDGETPGRLRCALDPMGGPLAVPAMARAACFSQRQFHRLTLALIGETPGAHQRRRRLDRAAWLLLISRATVLEIALETGWQSHETFTRAFRAHFGIAPCAFRQTRGALLPRSIRAGFSIALRTYHEQDNT